MRIRDIFIKKETMLNLKKSREWLRSMELVLSRSLKQPNTLSLLSSILQDSEIIPNRVSSKIKRLQSQFSSILGLNLSRTLLDLPNMVCLRLLTCLSLVDLTNCMQLYSVSQLSSRPMESIQNPVMLLNA